MKYDKTMLKALRLSLGETQETFSSRVGMSTRSVNRYENGSSVLTPKRFNAVLKACGATLNGAELILSEYLQDLTNPPKVEVKEDTLQQVYRKLARNLPITRPQCDLIFADIESKTRAYEALSEEAKKKVDEEFEAFLERTGKDKTV